MAGRRHQPATSVKRLADLPTNSYEYMAVVIDWYGPYDHTPNDPEQIISQIAWWGEDPALYAGFGMGEQPDDLQHIGFTENVEEYFRQLVRGEGQGDGGVQSGRSVCSRYYLGWIGSQAIAGPHNKGRLYLNKFAEWVLVTCRQPRSNSDSWDVPNHGGIIWSRWWQGDFEEYPERIPRPLQSWPELLTCTMKEEEEEDTNPRHRIRGIDLPPRE